MPTKKSKPKQPEPDIEKLALEVRQKREVECEKAVHEVLARYNCQMTVVVRPISAAEPSADGWMPLGSVLGLPSAILIASK